MTTPLRGPSHQVRSELPPSQVTRWPERPPPTDRGVGTLNGPAGPAALPGGDLSRCLRNRLSDHHLPIVEHGIDWLQGTWDHDHRAASAKDLRDLEHATAGVLPADGWEHCKNERRHEWSRILRGPGGAELWADNPRFGVHLRLPGDACERIGTAGLVCVASRFRKVSRLDLRIDDYDRRKDPADIWPRLIGTDGHWCPDVGVVTKVKTGSYLQDAATGGRTCYVGSRSSDRQLRVYDKGAESAGEIDAIRWELQCRGDKAQAVRRELLAMQTLDELPAVIGGVLRGFVEFRVSRGVRDNVERWDLEPWWSELTARAQVVRVALPDDRSLVTRKLARSKWVDQMLPTLVAWSDAAGFCLLDDNLADQIRRKRFTARHRLIVRGVA